MTDPILTLEAPLLFDEALGAPDYTRFLERLNDRLKPQGLRLHRSQAPDETTALFSGRDFHILISPSDAPLPAGDFAAALASPLAELVPADFPALVAAHVCHLGVSVGDGPLLKTKELTELEEKFGILQEVKPADRGLKTRVLHLAVLSLLDAVEPEPTAIHWRPTELLLTPDAFCGLSDSEFPGALIFTPEEMTQGTGAQGQPLLGFTARGAAAVCGRPVVLEPAPLDLAEGVDLVAELIARHAAGSVDLSQTGEIKLSPTARARVAEGRSGGAHPDGYISVTFLPGPAPLFEGDDAPGEEPVAEPALAEIEPQATPAAAEARPAHAEAAPAVAKAAPAEIDPEPPAAGADRVLRLGSLLTAASAPGQATQAPPEPDAAPASEAAPAHLSEPEDLSAPVPETAAEPETVAPAAAPKAEPASKAAALLRLGEAGIDRVYNPEPAKGMLRHLLIAVAIVLVAPLPGFVLLIATLIRGPLPKLTLGCAILALANVAYQASSYLSLLS